MTVIQAPLTLQVGAQSFGQIRHDIAESSDATGATADRLLGVPRWVMSMGGKEAMTLAAGGEWEALLIKMRGSVNRLAAWDFNRPAPLGTARGAIVLASSAVAGAVSVAVSGALAGVNLVRGGSFEVDSNADGLCDHWLVSVGGAGDGGRAHSLTRQSSYAVAQGTYCQEVQITAATNTNDSVLYLQTRIAVSGSTTYTLRGSLYANVSSKAHFMLRQYDAGGSVVGSDTLSAYAPNGSAAFLTSSVTTEPTAATMDIAVRGITLVGEFFRVDALQFELGAAATTFAGQATLLPGDWLQIGTPGLSTSQLVKVTDSVTLNDIGSGTVLFEAPLRWAIASGQPVGWERALGYYRAAGKETRWQAVAGSVLTEGHSGDFVEVWS